MPFRNVRRNKIIFHVHDNQIDVSGIDVADPREHGMAFFSGFCCSVAVLPQDEDNYIIMPLGSPTKDRP